MLSIRASREKVGTGFSQKRCDNKQLEQDAASELAHLALGSQPNLTERPPVTGGLFCWNGARQSSAAFLLETAAGDCRAPNCELCPSIQRNRAGVAKCA
jgi:hypothetical protein